MKEIWMEKLIELLNEYLRETKKAELYDFYIKWDYIVCDFLSTVEDYGYVINSRIEMDYGDEILISKSLWFIKWLVENDKINTSKAKDKNLNGYEIELRIRAVKELVADSEEKTVLYLNLLMILAIQDEPIQFLISILK